MSIAQHIYLAARLSLSEQQAITEKLHTTKYEIVGKAITHHYNSSKNLP